MERSVQTDMVARKASAALVRHGDPAISAAASVLRQTDPPLQGFARQTFRDYGVGTGTLTRVMAEIAA